MASSILQVRDLHTFFETREGVVKAVNGVSLSLEENTVLGVVGESGSGKTMTALSILQLVPFPGKVVAGSVRYNGTASLSAGYRIIALEIHTDDVDLELNYGGPFMGVGMGF